MTDRTLRCPNGHVVGVRLGPQWGGLFALRHGGQEALVAQVVSIRCICGAVWRSEVSRQVLEDLEVKAAVGCQ